LGGKTQGGWGGSTVNGKRRAVLGVNLRMPGSRDIVGEYGHREGKGQEKP